LGNVNMVYIKESIDDKVLFKVLFLAGIPGSGKSTTLKKITSGSLNVRIVNVDKYVEHSNIEGNLYGTEVYEKARGQVRNELYLLANGLLPIIIDGTSSKHFQTIKRRQVLEKIGYDCGMVVINVSLEKARERIEKRNKILKRKVSLDALDQLFNDLEDSKKKYREEFDFYLEIDNNNWIISNNDIMSAFKKSYQFFTSPVENPIGRAIIDRMKEQKLKYLVPGIFSKSQLTSIIKDFV